MKDKIMTAARGLDLKIIAYVLTASISSGGGVLTLDNIFSKDHSNEVQILQNKVRSLELEGARLDGENLKQKVDDIYEIVLKLQAKAETNEK